uniref:Protein kinase domain-containing protein n=2 Tax=Davidia involucrata TaxID=16924 RepID=A0A5B7BFP0_DAVIN
MNPRISDFGLARIVGGKEMEANTNKVVGTYGYMSPEYALEGLFSIKSDVFSFGVVVLEIISGKKNTGFYQSQQTWNLLGYAWRLWKEEKALDLMDHTLPESCNTSDVLKCIIIGLLCVQEDPGDRPTMSNVVFMLGSETATLPNPKQPVFITRKCNSSTPSSSSSKPAEARSTNELTVSMEEGR